MTQTPIDLAAIRARHNEAVSKIYKTDDLQLYKAVGESLNDIAALLAEIDGLKAWVNDLQSNMYINCAYCGHQYGPSETTPASMADVLKEHIENCPKHPMSSLKIEIDRLTRERDAAVGDLQETVIKLGDEFNPSCKFCKWEDAKCERFNSVADCWQWRGLEGAK